MARPRKSCKTCALYEEVLSGRGIRVASWVKRCEAGCEPISARWCKAYAPEGKRDGYDELLCAVQRKFPGETRHETALRYIAQAEKCVFGVTSNDHKREGNG